MTTHQDIRIRQALWSEYHSGSDKNQALENICNKVGVNSISLSTINACYQDFKDYESFLFYESINKREYPALPVIQTLPNGEQKDIAQSILFVSDTGCDIITVIDGRLAISYISGKCDQKFYFYDLFHNERKEVPVVNGFDRCNILDIQMIGQEHLLIYANTGSLLTKIDYKLWEMNVVKRYPSLGPKTRVDALDSRKFIIKSYREFVTCSLKNDSITFVTRNQNLDILNLRYSKLIGNQLLGFRETYRDNNAGIRVWNYCNIDLDTLTEQAVEVPMILGENRFLCQFDRLAYCWSKDRLYLVVCPTMRKDYVVSFNSKTLTWTNTGIKVYGVVRSMFVDREDVLTLQTSGPLFLGSLTFYRFPLKKPDSLKNIAWLTVVRNAKLFKSTLFDKIRHRLPFGKGIRSIFDVHQ